MSRHGTYDLKFGFIPDDDCPQQETPKQANADRIRAMSDEELADIICDHACMLCPLENCDGRMEIGRDACYKRWLDWLKQEVEK